MAKQKKTTAKSSTKSEDSNVIRISASEKPAKKPAKSTVATKKSVKAVKAPREQKSGRRNPISALLEYFKGAWTELRLVRWPTRRATWGLTLAVLLFSAFFVVFILLIDTGFKFLFDTIYKQ